MRDSSAIYRPADRDPKSIPLIVEIHLLLGAGSASGSMDAANILKPAVARGAIRVIGATTIRNCSGVSMSVADFHVMAEFNKRPADRGVTVELDESTEELILREGFSEEYGARNLERVVDRMLGTLIAEALLGGEISDREEVGVMAKGSMLLLHHFPEC